MTRIGYYDSMMLIAVRLKEKSTIVSKDAENTVDTDKHWLLLI